MILTYRLSANNCGQKSDIIITLLFVLKRRNCPFFAARKSRKCNASTFLQKILCQFSQKSKNKNHHLQHPLAHLYLIKIAHAKQIQILLTKIDKMEPKKKKSIYVKAVRYSCRTLRILEGIEVKAS